MTDEETGAQKSYKIVEATVGDNFESVMLTTASGVKITVDMKTNEGDLEEESGRKLLRYRRSRYSFSRVSRSRSFDSRSQKYNHKYQSRKSAMLPKLAEKRSAGKAAYAVAKYRTSYATVNYSMFTLGRDGDRLRFNVWGSGSGRRKLSQFGSGSGSGSSSWNSMATGGNSGSTNILPTYASDFPNATPYECTSGSVTIGNASFPCDDVGVHSFLSLSDLSMTDHINDVWGWTSSGGDDLVVVGSCTHFAVVTVTDPNNPIVEGTYALGGQLDTGNFFGDSDWTDMKING